MATREYVEGLAHVASDPHALYDWIKRIDGDPRPGASVIMAMRVKMFCDLRTRQMFYEPLSGYDRVLRALQLLRRVGEGAWVRSDQQDHLQISFDIFKSAHSVDFGRLELPAAGEQPVGVHSVKVTGWHDGGETLAFANSWGRGWGDHGYGAVPRAHLDRYLRDAWLFRNARYGFTRFDRARLPSTCTRRNPSRTTSRSP